MSRPAFRSLTFYRPFFSDRYLLLLAGLALFGLIEAWLIMATLSQKNPWYSNAELNAHNMASALALNSGESPGWSDQPGLPTQCLLALDYRLRHYAGMLPVWNTQQLAEAADPLPAIAQLIQIGRLHNRLLVIFFILTAGALMYAVTHHVKTALLAVIFLSASAGLLFQGLFNRPDLLCVWFGTILSPFFLWRATRDRGALPKPAGLFFAGLSVGLSILTKLPGLYYFISAGLWCWFCALVDRQQHKPRDEPLAFSVILWPVISSVLVLGLLVYLAESPLLLSPSARERIQFITMLTGTLSLFGWFQPRSRWAIFLAQRALELAILTGGTLAAMLAGYVALRVILPADTALTYLGRTLEFVVHPDPQMRYLLAATPRVGGEFFLFVRESPFLFISATGIALSAWRFTAFTRRIPALACLLAANAIAMAWILSHRYFLDQFTVYFQTPLVLASTLGFFALGLWQPTLAEKTGIHWAVRPVIVGTVVLLLTVWLRLDPKQQAYRTENQPPLRELTITYLYNHDALPATYRKIMAAHYGSRQKFVAALEKSLPQFSDLSPDAPVSPPTR